MQQLSGTFDASPNIQTNAFFLFNLKLFIITKYLAMSPSLRLAFISAMQ
jgi:hypothetical protein